MAASKIHLAQIKQCLALGLDVKIHLGRHTDSKVVIHVFKPSCTFLL